ncbi:hypothetical protein AAMO2058_001631900 [Amorphochlora amoebiformis]
MAALGYVGVLFLLSYATHAVDTGMGIVIPMRRHHERTKASNHHSSQTPLQPHSPLNPTDASSPSTSSSSSTSNKNLRASRDGKFMGFLQQRESERGQKEANTSTSSIGNITVAAGVSAKDMCDMTLERGLCLYGGSTLVVPEANPPALRARYTFEKSAPIDTSGNANHGLAAPAVGPGRLGVGRSGSFGGKGFVVPHSTTLEAGLEISLSFWVFVREQISKPSSDTPDDLRLPLIVKGDGQSPALYSVSLNRTSGSIIFDTSAGMPVSSFARVRPRKWYHIAVTLSDTNVRLYVNGVMDNTKQIPKNLAGAANSGPLTIGGAAAGADTKSPTPLLIDDVSIYSRVLDAAEIEAGSFPALGPIEPGFLRLGCPLSNPCGVTTAVEKCGNSFHVCKQLELLAGGYQAATSLGWMSHDTTVWTWEDSLPTKSNTDTTAAPGSGNKVAICCQGFVSAS